MAASPAPKTWAIEPHTEAKLVLLSTYLKAWFPILSRGGFPRVIYIDGFAGPGRYEGGQYGSPTLALRTLAEQTIELNSTFEFHFVEGDPAVVQSLRLSLEDLKRRGLMPAKAEVTIHEGIKFEEAYETSIRPRLMTYSNAPTFALVDPFGWTGIPMRIIADLLRRPHTEVLINFMFEEINRFLALPEQSANFDALFGGPDWRSACQLAGRQRQRAIHDYYRDQLHRAGEARYVRSFEMRNERDVVDYFLFFATNNLLGLRKMKEAMWRVDPSGGVSFSDATNPDQITLFGSKPDHELLRRLIGGHFAGRRVRVRDVETYVVEETAFLPSKRVLRDIEACGDLRVIGASTSRRVGTFPDPDLLLEFTPAKG